MVNPGAALSLQMHHHRAEHWVVVRGTARVTRGDETLLLSENESTYIPVGTWHLLENPGKLPLEIIEVKSGAYLGRMTSSVSTTLTVEINSSGRCKVRAPKSDGYAGKNTAATDLHLIASVTSFEGKMPRLPRRSEAIPIVVMV